MQRRETIRSFVLAELARTAWHRSRFLFQIQERARERFPGRCVTWRYVRKLSEEYERSRLTESAARPK